MDKSTSKEFINKWGEAKWGKMLDLMREIEDHLKYKFMDIENLLQALIVRGDLLDKQHFEMQEFLGDSILNLIISEYLIDNFNLKKPEELTRIKSMMTKNSYLASLSKSEPFSVPVKKIEDLFEITLTEKHLSDAFEAILGAIYIDLGYDKNKIKPIILEMIKIKDLNIEELLLKENLKDKKSLLNEWTQKEYGGEVSVTYPYHNKGSDHKPRFYVGLQLKSKDGKIIFQEDEIGPFDRLKDGEVAVSEKFLLKIA